jgi:hypothetical protein
LNKIINFNIHFHSLQKVKRDNLANQDTKGISLQTLCAERIGNISNFFLSFHDYFLQYKTKLLQVFEYYQWREFYFYLNPEKRFRSGGSIFENSIALHKTVCSSTTIKATFRKKAKKNNLQIWPRLAWNEKSISQTWVGSYSRRN